MKTPHDHALEALELAEETHQRLIDATEYKGAPHELETARTLIMLVRRELARYFLGVERRTPRVPRLPRLPRA